MQKTSCVSTKTKFLGRQWSARSPFIPIAAPLPPTEKAPGQLVRRLNPLPAVGGSHLAVFALRDRPADFQLQLADFQLQPVDAQLQPERLRVADQVGHLKRIYAFEELPPGRVVALPGQKGPQADMVRVSA